MFLPLTKDISVKFHGNLLTGDSVYFCLIISLATSIILTILSALNPLSSSEMKILWTFVDANL